MTVLLLQLDALRHRAAQRQGREHSLTEVIRYIDANFTRNITLEEMAERFFISKYHLSREFKNYFGITPNHYVIGKRITLAKKLLRFSDMTLEEISTQCGFYDSSYMNKQFKSSEGIGATEFRRKWMN